MAGRLRATRLWCAMACSRSATVPGYQRSSRGQYIPSRPPFLFANRGSTEMWSRWFIKNVLGKVMAEQCDITFDNLTRADTSNPVFPTPPACGTSHLCNVPDSSPKKIHLDTFTSLCFSFPCNPGEIYLLLGMFHAQVIVILSGGEKLNYIQPSRDESNPPLPP